MSGSATYTTNYEVGTLRTFASLRFMGDRLEPASITTILGTASTIAYRKSEIFKRSRGHEARGRTGLWVLSSDCRVADGNLDAHLRYLLAIISPDGTSNKIVALRQLMHERQLRADVTCFWYGTSGTATPVIAGDVRAAFARLPAEIATDFETD
jgi:hypothetical protein